MSDITNSNNPSVGTVVFLIDESQSLSAPVAGGTKSRAQTLATALNSMLNQLATVPSLEVALVGYRCSAQGGDDIGLRWSGPLEGRTFVSSRELAESPLRVEERVRRIPGVPSGGQETVRFPVWYDPRLGPPGLPTAAVEYCGRLLTQASVKTPHPPLVLHLLATVEDGRPTPSIAGALPDVFSPESGPLLLNAHLGSSDRIPATLYPSNDTHLAPQAVRTLFHASSVLPEAFADALRQTRVTVNSGARGMIHNGTMIDLIRFLALTKTYATCQGAVAPTQDVERPDEATVTMAASDATVSLPADVAAQPPDHSARRVLLVLLLDRSISAEQRDNPNNAWVRLQLEANRLLGQLAADPTGRMDVAVVCSTLEGPLADSPMLADTNLAEAAIRVEQFEEQVSNGIGGLISVTRKRPIFLDLPPCAETPEDLEAMMRTVAGLFADGDREPVVVHFTRAEFDPTTLRKSLGAPVVLHHLIATETPHPSIAYPADANGLVGESLKTAWQVSSPLVGVAKLAADKSGVTPESRGMVVNGQFDLLIEGLKQILTDTP